MILYVSNAESGDIRVLHLDAASARIETLQRVEVGDQVMPLALAPQRTHLYAAVRSEPYRVVSLRIDPGSGHLHACATAPLPHSMAYLWVDASGRHLLGASYPGALLSVSPIGPDGAAGAPRQIVPTSPKAHAIQTDPSNRFALAPILGGDEVMQLRFDPVSGTLHPNRPRSVAARPGAGPRHLRFHPEGRFVYVLNELDGSLDVYAFDPARGTLGAVQTVSAVPPGLAVDPSAADLHLTPDARLLYASERSSSTLAAFAVHDAGARLVPLGFHPTEEEPRGFAITPEGSLLVALGLASHHLSLYRIDPVDGDLQRLARMRVGDGPNWVEILELAPDRPGGCG